MRDARHVTRNGTFSVPGIQPIPHWPAMPRLVSYTRAKTHTRHGWSATWGTLRKLVFTAAAVHDVGVAASRTRCGAVGAPAVARLDVGRGARPHAGRTHPRGRVPADPGAPAGGPAQLPLGGFGDRSAAP